MAHAQMHCHVPDLRIGEYLRHAVARASVGLAPIILTRMVKQCGCVV